jgi:hypothetical protein
VEREREREGWMSVWEFDRLNRGVVCCCVIVWWTCFVWDFNCFVGLNRNAPPTREKGVGGCVQRGVAPDFQYVSTSLIES